MTMPGALEDVYRSEARRVLATLIRLLGGFDSAEDALHEAFAAAAEHWPKEGIPANPYAWLVSTGRFRLIDRWRRQQRLDRAMNDPAHLAEVTEAPVEGDGMDDQLRLVFMCCHPSLSPDGRVALTLREVAGLTTEEIARAYLTPAPTVAQRIVRTKARIRDCGIAFDLPETADLPERIDSVLQVIYLIFNEGYAATFAPGLVRADLCAEAVRLGRLVAGLIEDSEAKGLLALMLLHQARQATRLDEAGDIVLLEDQDRSRWDGEQIAEARRLIVDALTARRIGPYLIQAAIADLHVCAPDFAATDWCQVVGLYDVLLRIAPSPVAALNRAVAVGCRDGAEAGLHAVEAIMARDALSRHHPAHLARAEMLRRLGRNTEARAALQVALGLTQQAAEQRLITHKMAQL